MNLLLKLAARKAPKCILGAGCPWANQGCCATLGECGAAHALERAREPGGYEVLRHENRTIDALVKARLVTVTPADYGTAIVKAIDSNTGR